MAALAETVAWETSLEPALRRAAQAGRPVLIDFSAAPECRGCVAMDTVSYADSRVAQFIERHCVPVRLRIKDHRQLARDYLVSWTPHIVLADEQGRVHYRVEGFLPPQDLVSYLSLGVGKFHLDRMQFDEAQKRFEEVSERHAGADAGAEALYWLGVVRYKKGHDPAQLRMGWLRLGREYPENAWTKRTQIPEPTGSQAEKDIVEEASEESFPASDPPSWTAGRASD